MFLHFSFKLRVYNNKKMLDKTVFKFWFQILQKMAYIGASKNAKKIV